ncbi:MAG: Mur ligase family protein [Eubacteriales bacterium]|nr:Mur ligase family protein [Eubacteriales bacterium]MDD4769020.1 Mur ligase family protein [Eubacteriales bacterium]
MDAYHAIKFIYQSYVLAQPYITPGLLDIYKRHPGYCRQLLQDLDLDLSQPPSALITGSKGKGSTSAIIASLMQAAGYKTGLFTGPHLVDFCERIRIDWQKIPEPEFVRLVEAVIPYVETMQASMPRHHYLGPVGTVLAVALLWFKEQGTDFHVLECGRGALADDVNVMANRWSVLTPIMFEHPGYLGPTLLDIAANKMAVVKSGQELCVSYRQDPEVARLLKSMCRAVQVPLKLGGEDFSVQVVKTGPEGSAFAYQSSRRKSVFKVPLAGRFQAFNAGVAVALAEEVVPDIDDDVLQAGLDSARWPGRCELVAGTPPIILDGAINAQSAEYLRELLAEREEPLYIVLGVPADKDWQGVIRTLAPAAEAVWLTAASNAHLVFPPAEDVLAAGKKYNPRSQAIPEAAEAIEEAVAAAGTGGTVVVAGTLSLLRDAKVYIQSRLGRECDE